MSKRRQEHEQGQGTCRRLQKQKQKHLYLVLDDWDKGFTIRKIDGGNPRLGEPPVLRLVAPLRRPGKQHLRFMHNGTLVYDTETAALATGPCLPDPLLDGVNVFVAAGDMLYALAYYFALRPHSFEVMSTATNKGSRPSTPALDWSWQSVPSSSPFDTEEAIVSYAVHPDGHTIFMSSRRLYRGRTFSFDTRRCEWRYHGEWRLPFKGKGYFDSQLDAWVGLHDESGGICSCQVASRSSTSNIQPEWKTVKEKLWSQKKLALGPTLTYMGGARFCIVECVLREGLKKYGDAFVMRESCKPSAVPPTPATLLFFISSLISATTL
ncbi:hypothetical protein HU200_054801 [Digitaria exilis]|uniref:Uncharacterized protein n=1 Tax=Digitaria exilis TaxID=1010633 RepID=A0A835E3T1_9POAL|nr:hypothetical protein HU200_054801 [Digitaria exilis]